MKKIILFVFFFPFFQLCAADDYSIELYAMSGSGRLVSSDEMMKKSESESYGYTDEPIVSTDIIGDTHGSVFDATQTKVIDLNDGRSLVQVVAWYDNENSYTSQMVRTAKYLKELD